MTAVNIKKEEEKEEEEEEEEGWMCRTCRREGEADGWRVLYHWCYGTAVNNKREEEMRMTVGEERSGRIERWQRQSVSDGEAGERESWKRESEGKWQSGESQWNTVMLLSLSARGRWERQSGSDVFVRRRQISAPTAANTRVLLCKQATTGERRRKDVMFQKLFLLIFVFFRFWRFDLWTAQLFFGKSTLLLYRVYLCVRSFWKAAGGCFVTSVSKDFWRSVDSLSARKKEAVNWTIGDRDENFCGFQTCSASKTESIFGKWNFLLYLCERMHSFRKHEQIVLHYKCFKLFGGQSIMYQQEIIKIKSKVFLP